MRGAIQINTSDLGPRCILNPPKCLPTTATAAAAATTTTTFKCFKIKGNTTYHVEPNGYIKKHARLYCDSQGKNQLIFESYNLYGL